MFFAEERVANEKRKRMAQDCPHPLQIYIDGNLINELPPLSFIISTFTVRYFLFSAS